MNHPSVGIAARLEAEPIIWLATVRPTGRPHLVPLWFVWMSGSIYLCVAGGSVKVRNIAANPAVALALESGSAPVVVEGQATVLARPWPEEVVQGFQRKYSWRITTDSEYDTLIAVALQRWLMAQT
ncbi:MAG: pyridoxamine 5'-phosphate oxidase family protein [Chloroflexaceae bacterium]|nr:pyridoxamine 5'-phosphate oxidase family protein [Chloroflexaceae bacterium]